MMIETEFLGGNPQRLDLKSVFQEIRWLSCLLQAEVSHSRSEMMDSENYVMKSLL